MHILRVGGGGQPQASSASVSRVLPGCQLSLQRDGKARRAVASYPSAEANENERQICTSCKRRLFGSEIVKALLLQAGFM
jgi:hypothetical protein